MKIYTFLLLSIILSTVSHAQTGFTSITQLQPIALSEATKDKPQAKVWAYAKKWWCVLSAVKGTTVFRLDGNSWTEILTLNIKSSKPDCRISGDLVHILFYKGASNKSILYSIKYDKSSGTYTLWDQRPGGTSITFPELSQTATLVLDKKGRMWAGTNTATNMKVWWSDAPYTNWSAPITIVRGTDSGDICALTAIGSQDKIGLLWSNRNDKKFGFKTHRDGSEPSNWSEDEVPASQSAIAGTGGGMADDHINIKVAQNGTLYCIAKTEYNRPGMPKIILMVRRPSGTWDNAYTVTMDQEGTQPIIILNEERRIIKAIYTSKEKGGSILYRESSIDNIAFGNAFTLMKGGANMYDFATSTHQNYQQGIVILATDLSSNPKKAIGVLAIDPVYNVQQPIIFRKLLNAYPNPVSSSTIFKFALQYAGNYTLTLYSQTGTREIIITKGWAEAGVPINVLFNTNKLSNTTYFVTLQTDLTIETIKLLVQK